MQFSWKKEYTIIGAASFVIGAGTGYAVATYQKRLSRKVSDSIDAIGDDLESLKEKVEESGARTLEAAWDIIKNQEIYHNGVKDNADTMEDEDESPQPPQVANVFDVIDHNWDYEEEEKHRTEDAPYIIHRDEYDDEAKSYSQSTLTYYEGDDVLVDEKDVPLYNQTQIIGDKASNLIWGKGSGDQSIVYIRNDKLQAEYEIIRDEGFYQVEVLGTEIEDQLSVDKPQLQKFRPE